MGPDAKVLLETKEVAPQDHVLGQLLKAQLLLWKKQRPMWKPKRRLAMFSSYRLKPEL